MKLWCLTQGNWLSSNSGIQRWYLPNYQLDSLCFPIGCKIPLQLDHTGTGISNSRSFQAMKFALHFLDETMDIAWPTSTSCKSLVILELTVKQTAFVCQYFSINSRSSTLIHLKKRHGPNSHIPSPQKSVEPGPSAALFPRIPLTAPWWPLKAASAGQPCYGARDAGTPSIQRSFSTVKSNYVNLEPFQ